MGAPALPVRGADVVARGVKEGPEVGELLRKVENWWIASDFAPNRAALLDRLDALVAERPQEVTARLLASRSRRFYPLVPCSQLVMAGLVPAIHATAHPPTEQSDEMPGTSPGMTVLRAAPYSAASAAPSRP